MAIQPVYIPAVFGFSAELEKLVALIPKDRKIVFMGNYFNFGPDPIGTAEFISNLSLDRIIELRGSELDRAILVASGAVEPKIHERSDWISPYSGVCSLPPHFNLSPFSVFSPQNDEHKSRFLQGLKKSQVLQVLENANFKSTNINKKIISKICPFGNQLIAVDEDSETLFSVESVENYYSVVFLPWLMKHLSLHIYSGTRQVSFRDAL